MIHTIYLGLGSNLGQKQRNLKRAIQKIQELIGTVECQSALYVSSPWGTFDSKEAPSFINVVIRCSTQLSPREVLTAAQHIEQQMGKRALSRKDRDGKLLEGQTYHNRVIDIDILLYDDLHIDEPDLQIPHPLMQERDFVMMPLREVLL